MKAYGCFLRLLLLMMPVLQGCEGCSSRESAFEQEQRKQYEEFRKAELKSKGLPVPKEEPAEDEGSINTTILLMGLTTGTVHDAKKHQTEVVAKNRPKTCITPAKSALLKQKATVKAKTKTSTKTKSTQSGSTGLPAGLPGIPGGLF